MFHDEEKLVCIRGGDAVPVRVRKLQLQNQVTLAAELRAARVDPVKTPGHSLCFLVRILGFPLWIAIASSSFSTKPCWEQSWTSAFSEI